MDKALQRQQTRERVKRYRKKAKDVTLTPDSVTLHPVVYMLADPVKRDKLRRICSELSNKGLLGDVVMGVRRPLSMGEVGDLVEAVVTG